MPPDSSKSLKVQTDASDIGLGTVLTQEPEKGEHVIAYAPRLLQGAENHMPFQRRNALPWSG